MGILKFIVCKYVNIVVVGLDFVVVFFIAFFVNFTVVSSVVLFIRFCLYFMILILILSGDVELNPGPAVQYQKKNCKVLYSNIRGLRTNFLDLQSHARSYDILFLSETLVTSNKAQSEFLLPGFDGPQFVYRCSTPNAQGMAVYSRSGLPVYRQKPLECLCHELLCFKVYSKHYNVYVFALYRNPNHDDSIYDCILEKIALAQSQDPKASFVICGDCNAKHKEWLGSNITDMHGRSALEFSAASACDQLINEPTHKDGNRLDLVFTDVPAIVTSKVCEFIGTSDHCAIEMNISVNQYVPNSVIEKKVWLKSRANWDPIDQACKALNISEAIQDQHPMHRLNQMLLPILERHVPRKIIKIRTNDQPWFDDTCRRAYHDKQTKFNVWQHRKSRVN